LTGARGGAIKLSVTADQTTAARSIFETAIAQAKAEGDAGKADKRRLLCEFFCNPEFRKAMEDEVARINRV
jgi:hypothetical protein